jgi:hypothetical protein
MREKLSAIARNRPSEAQNPAREILDDPLWSQELLFDLIRDFASTYEERQNAAQ